jgi:hypothetical protein
MGRTKLMMGMPLAVLALGATASARPAAAREQAAATAAAAQPAVKPKTDKPLVMLVCREVRGRAGAGGRVPNLACVTRWASL